MRASRRVLVWIAVLGLLLALFASFMPPHGAAPPERAEVVFLPAGSAVAAQVPASDAVPEAAAARTVDESDRRCENILEDAVKFTGWVDLDPDEQEVQRMLAQLSSVQRKLAGSRDPEQYLTVLLLDPVDARVVSGRSIHTTMTDLGARAADSGSPLLAWHALRICVEAKEHCPYAHLEQRLLDADRENADSWALVAMLRYRRGDNAGALSAMQGAAQAPTSTSYWTQTIGSVERTLAAGSDIPPAMRISTAIGVSAAALSTGPHEMCRVESAASRPWAQACLAFGTLSGRRNETMLAQGLSFSLREQALTALGDIEAAAEVAAGRALHDAQLHSMSSGPVRQRSELQFALIAADPARLEEFLAAVRQHGEIAGAREFFRQHVPSLMERAGLLDRDGARECAASLFSAPEPAGSRATMVGHRIQAADQLFVSLRGGMSQRAMMSVRPDGKIALRRLPEIQAAGRTIGELEREIAAALPVRDRPTDVHVILLKHPTPADLRREFDEALRR